MKVDNCLHRKSIEIALADEPLQYEMLQQLLNFTFQIAKEGNFSHEFIKKGGKSVAFGV